jgi:excisionase family DNA binding protein
VTATALLTLQEAAGELGCSVTTVKRRIRAGVLPAFVDGRVVRVRQADLRRYVAERTAVRVARAHPSRAAARRSREPEGKLWD